jgi:predicted transcriptional regulator
MLLDNRISGMPVVDENNRLIGMVTEKDCIKALMREVHHHMPPCLVHEVMTTEVIDVHEDDHMLTIADIFIMQPIRRLPVTRNGLLVGQISRRDLLAAADRVFDESGSHEAAVLYLSALDGKPPV